jgi:branched-chain amino acid transport system substrate-binding protein
MSDFTLRMPRRGFLGVAAAAAGALALPAYAQNAPLRIGQTLPLTGPLAAVGAIHRLAAEVFVANVNADGGMLGRPLELVLLDDQSQPANARSLYERLVTADNVDLLMGPYGTTSIIAAIGVAQRFGKVLIQSSLGDPRLAPYALQFPALPLGPQPHVTNNEVLLDAYASSANPPRTIAFVTSRFPSALTIAQAGQEVAAARGLEVSLSLEYDFGTRDFGPIASRIRNANPDVLWFGGVGMETVQLLDAMGRLQYQPPRHFSLFPAPGPTAAHADAEGLTTLTWFEEHAPFSSNTGAAKFIETYVAAARTAGLPYAYAEYQAASEYSAWQILEAAITGTGGTDDAAMADWLRANAVETVMGRRSFEGEFNAGQASTKIKQVQSGQWVTVWPAEFRPASASVNI